MVPSLYDFSCSQRPDPHSFPTRRSSDLRCRAPALSVSLLFHTRFLFSSCRSLPTSFAARLLRSEEHTSELQSRENLVCRLLVEKKNACQAGRWRSVQTSSHCRRTSLSGT